MAFPARAANDPAGLGAGVLAGLQHLHTIHEDVRFAVRKLVWLLECRMIGDGLGIEHNDIGEVTGFQATPVSDFQVGSGEGCQRKVS